MDNIHDGFVTEMATDGGQPKPWICELSGITHNKIPFALKDGALVEVSDVESGLACRCICPACKRPLQARKGRIRSHYFAHDPSAGTGRCATAFETSIHLMAKQIVDEDCSLMFSELIIKRTAEDLAGGHHSEEIRLEESGVRFFDRVELEKGLDDIRPDITAYVCDEPFLIEVAVTSFADNDKKRKIRKRQVPAIEIDLHSVDYSITKNDLRELLNSDSTKKKWLSHPRAKDAKKDLKTRLDARIGRINESLSRANRESREFENRYARQLVIGPAPAPIYALDGAEESGCERRWFHCESCRCNFELSVQADTISIRAVPCPNCRASVSTRSCRTRY